MIFLLVWKVAGGEIVHIGLGFLLFLIGLVVWMWSYRRTCMDRRVLIKTTKGVDKSVIKEWKVIPYEVESGEFTPRAAHFLYAVALIVVTLFTVFSW